MLLKRGRLPILALVFLVFVGVSILEGKFLKAQRNTALEDSAERIKLKISSGLTSRLNLIYSLVGLFQLYPDLSHDEFNLYSATVIEYNPPIRAIQYADENTTVKYVYPPKGNKSVIDTPLTLLKDPKRAPFVKKAIDSRVPVIQGPFKLRQGGVGCVVRYPIFIGESFSGLAIVVIDLSSIMNEALLGFDTENINIQLFDASDNKFWGNDFPVEAKAIRTVDVADTKWQVVASWRGPEFSFLRTEFILIWIVALIFLGGTNSYLTTLAKQKKQIENLVEKRTAQLQAKTNQLSVKMTERNTLLGELEEQKAILGDILESTLSGYWDWNIPSNTEYLSPRFKSMFGYSDDEMPNSPESWQKIINQDDLERVLTNFEEHVHTHGKTPFYNEVRYQHKNGTEVWVVCAGRVISWSPSGDPIRMVGCHVNIDKQKKAEELLIEAKVVAESANAAKSNFLANMSHEIRTPLNGIVGILRLLKDSGLNHDQHEMVDMLSLSSQRLHGLLSDILDISRIEAEKIELNIEDLDLESLLQEAVDLFVPTAHQSGITLTCLSDFEEELFSGDKGRILQVLTNIIGNAVKFTNGGEIKVEGYNIYSEHHPKRLAQIVVSDTGSGVAKEEIEALFKPFVQASEGYQKNHQGAGLGLSICRRLVELMGGSILFDSETGEGTSVVISLPLKRV